MDKMYEMSFFNGPITNKVPLTTLGLIEVAAIVKSDASCISSTGASATTSTYGTLTEC